MKTEMAMLPNGNYERIVSPIQHECRFDTNWHCVEHGWDIGKLKLSADFDDPYEDGCTHEIIVNYCPFCGYKPTK